MAQEMAQEKNLQPWEYVYDLLMPAKIPPRKRTKYIYLALAVPPTMEFNKKISKGDTEDLELPVYPVAFNTRPGNNKADRIATRKDLLTRLGTYPTVGLYANDYDFTMLIKNLDFKSEFVPGYFPLAVLELHFERDITANPEDYGLKPIDGREWVFDPDGSYKVTSGSLFNIAKAEIVDPNSVTINLDKNSKEFNALNGYGVVQFYIDLNNAPWEAYAKAAEECESVGGIYRHDTNEGPSYCTLPLNKEANIKASEFILQLYDMIKSKIASEDFLKREMTFLAPGPKQIEDFLKNEMMYQPPGPKRIPVKPVIGKTFQEMVKVAEQEMAKVAEKRDLILGGEEKEPKQKSQEKLFNPFAIDYEMLTEEQQQQNETEEEEKNNTVKLS
ncbi:hypothetical protein [Acidianus two-tailed phage variant 1]|uniref:Uncharacterized protein n=1 Tax=Acidianus two-tailed phage variant 1 TaxID=1898550 RepID=A0A1C9EGC3_ATV|nr:hypothetical protein [Acidianus two-tailed phage variant 1]